ncbi:MAG: hypothetical protein ACYC1U_08500 [Candidatus Aquicultorales bacterium]
MSCLDDSRLRSFIDREMSGRNRWRAELHLSQCRSCAERLEAIQQADALASDAASLLRDNAASCEPDLVQAWARLGTNLERKPGPRWMEGLSMSRKSLKYASAAAAVALVAGAFALAPVRSFASQLLDVFRVSKLETVNVTFADMQKIESALSGRGDLDLENFGAIKTEGMQEYRSVTLEEARSALAFDVKLPSGLAQQSLSLQTAMSAKIAPKVDQVNALLKSLGGTKMLPQSLDGKEFEIKIPAALVADFTREDGGRLDVYQSRGPELIAPPGVDIEDVRQALLQLPVIPENIRTQLEAIKDWRHTMIVPNIEGSSTKVRVGDSEGVFITPPTSEAPIPESREIRNYGTLIWQEDGVVYGISGELTKDQAIAIALTMQ